MDVKIDESLKEELQVYKNRLQKCIDIVFPEYIDGYKVTALAAGSNIELLEKQARKDKANDRVHIHNQY